METELSIALELESHAGETSSELRTRAIQALRREGIRVKASVCGPGVTDAITALIYEED